MNKADVTIALDTISARASGLYLRLLEGNYYYVGIIIINIGILIY